MKIKSGLRIYRMISLHDMRIADLPDRLRPLLASVQKQADISYAATELSKLSQEAKTRPQRVFTGRVFDHRAWRGMPVVLPNGQIGILHKAVRGAAVVTWRDEFALRPEQHVALDVSELKPFKYPAAVILGASKRGIKERPSTRKARAARNNGRCPVRPGRRPRGRPPAVHVMGI
jgi:hypothetical protein